MCPCCGQPLPSARRAGTYLPPLKARIFDVIEGSRSGIDIDHLAQRVYGETGGANRLKIRVHVSQINDVLAGTDTRISGDGKHLRGNYRIVSL